MRIVIVAEVYLPKVDGVVIRTRNLIQQLKRHGDEIVIVCPHAPHRGESPTPLVEFPSFPLPSYPEYLVGVPDARLVEAIDRFNPDIVHFINPFAFGFRCFDLLAKGGVDLPTVFSFHTLYGEFVKRYAMLKPLSKLLWWMMRDYHNCADANLTVSTIMLDELKSRGFERMNFWPPAVDSGLFHPGRQSTAMRQRLSGGRSDRPLLLTVSRLAPEKNVPFLADVMKHLPHAHLAIVGDGPSRGHLERRFAHLNATFVGYLQGHELAAAYASADAFVYASETETMGNVVLEAMASGLAVVAPRAGGIPSLMCHGETGLLFTPGSVEEAVGGVRHLLSDADARRRIGSAARDHLENSGWDKSVETVRRHYEATIEAHSRGAAAVARRGRIAPAVLSSMVAAFHTVSKGQQRLDPRRTRARALRR